MIRGMLVSGLMGYKELAVMTKELPVAGEVLALGAREGVIQGVELREEVRYLNVIWVQDSEPEEFRLLISEEMF